MHVYLCPLNQWVDLSSIMDWKVEICVSFNYRWAEFGGDGQWFLFAVVVHLSKCVCVCVRGCGCVCVWITFLHRIGTRRQVTFIRRDNRMPNNDWNVSFLNVLEKKTNENQTTEKIGRVLDTQHSWLMSIINNSALLEKWWTVKSEGEQQQQQYLHTNPIMTTISESILLLCENVLTESYSCCWFCSVFNKASISFSIWLFRISFLRSA